MSQTNSTIRQLYESRTLPLGVALVIRLWALAHVAASSTDFGLASILPIVALGCLITLETVPAASDCRLPSLQRLIPIVFWLVPASSFVIAFSPYIPTFVIDLVEEVFWIAAAVVAVIQSWTLWSCGRDWRNGVAEWRPSYWTVVSTYLLVGPLGVSAGLISQYALDTTKAVPSVMCILIGCGVTGLITVGLSTFYIGKNMKFWPILFATIWLVVAFGIGATSILFSGDNLRQPFHRSVFQPSSW